MLRLPDIKLLDILKITCEVMGDQQAGRMFDSQAMQPSKNLGYKANKAQKIRADNADVDMVYSNNFAEMNTEQAIA